MAGSEEKHKEWFSRAYLMAVGASAGYTVQPQQDDVDGVDAVVRDGGITVDVQLKATAAPDYGQDCLKFDLNVPTYNKLRIDRNSPGYLVVAVVPKKRSLWLEHKEGHMSMHRLAYWLEITNMPVTPNRATIRLEIPLANRLTEDALVEIMAKARERVMTH